MTRTQSRWQKIKAGWRDTSLLLRQFRRPLAIFVVVMAAAGSLYFYLANLAGEPVRSLLESIYMVLSMSFFQPSAPFPQALQLQLFYFIMPVLGIGLAAQGLADFGFLFFNRRSRGKEWEMAAPIFASSAANVDITPPITIEGTPHSLARMEVAPKSALAGLPVSQVEQTFNISVVLVIHNGLSDFHPSGAARLEHGDRIAVLGHPEDISILVHKNHA